MDYGEVHSCEPSSTCTFSTLIPSPTMDTSSLPATKSMKIQKSGHIYDQCIREVEHGVVSSASRGMAKEATSFYKRLAYPFSQQKGTRTTADFTRFSLTYTKSLSLPHPLSSRSPLFVLLIIFLLHCVMSISVLCI